MFKLIIMFLGLEKERQRDRKNEKRLRGFHSRDGQKRRRY